MRVVKGVPRNAKTKAASSRRFEECQDTWDSILRVHRAMAQALLSIKVQIKGFQVIRNLSLLRAKEHEGGWDYSHHSISLTSSPRREGPRKEWMLACTPIWNHRSRGPKGGAYNLEGYLGGLQRAMWKYWSDTDIQRLGLQVLDILCPPGWIRGRLSANGRNCQHVETGICSTLFPNLVEVHITYITTPGPGCSRAAAQPMTSFWIPLDGTLDDVLRMALRDHP